MSKRTVLGRPKEIEAPVFRFTVTIDEKTANSLKNLGMGNMSLGVREAIRLLKQLQVIA